jgi:hypothetical protein
LKLTPATLRFHVFMNSMANVFQKLKVCEFEDFLPRVPARVAYPFIPAATPCSMFELALRFVLCCCVEFSCTALFRYGVVPFLSEQQCRETADKALVLLRRVYFPPDLFLLPTSLILMIVVGRKNKSAVDLLPAPEEEGLFFQRFFAPHERAWAPWRLVCVASLPGFALLSSSETSRNLLTLKQLVCLKHLSNLL